MGGRTLAPLRASLRAVARQLAAAVSALTSNHGEVVVQENGTGREIVPLVINGVDLVIRTCLAVTNKYSGEIDDCASKADLNYGNRN